MAKITSGNITVDVQFTEYVYGWVDYAFRFSSNGISIVSPEIMRWDYFFANEHLEDGLIPCLQKALDTDEDGYWEPLEPDMYIKIRPHHKVGWKDHQLNTRVISTSTRYEQELRAVDELRDKLGGKLPDDYFDLGFFVDAGQLKESVEEYTGDHISIEITVTRQELAVFVEELKREYAVFSEKYKEEMRYIMEEYQ